jgi:hypothetical protein
MEIDSQMVKLGGLAIFGVPMSENVAGYWGDMLESGQPASLLMPHASRANASSSVEHDL